MTSAKKLYAIMSFGAAMGFIASFWQTLEKLTLLKNSDAILSCNLSSVLNCSNVLNAPQSSVFGFPNSLAAVIFFAFILSVGLLGLTGSVLNSRLRLTYQALSLFFVGFSLWYFWQSIFNIGVVCIFCIFNFSGLLLINGAWLRLNYKDYGLNKKTVAAVERWVNKGTDIFFWSLIALLITLWAIIKFA
ncbi:MAG: vitamin K epoxide reductase family protein [Candidatus Saccharimonadales bacterium]